MSEHVPVLLDAAIDALAVRPDGAYVDATFGAGGHSRAILHRLRDGRLIGLDADPSATARAAQIGDPRFTFIRANFRELDSVLQRLGVQAVDGVLFDLGVSSMQLDDPRRGFTFLRPAPLDMRMNPDSGESAYDVLSTASESELARIFLEYGEERSARRIARAIVSRRERGMLPQTTAEFAGLIAGILQQSGKRERIHPATRAFQALRIVVNDELGALRDGLDQAIGHLKAGGRVVAISFHSLEDRIVKRTLRDDDRLEVVIRRPQRAGEQEVAANPRARSAKMRVAQRRAS